MDSLGRENSLALGDFSDINMVVGSVNPVPVMNLNFEVEPLSLGQHLTSPAAAADAAASKGRKRSYDDTDMADLSMPEDSDSDAPSFPEEEEFSISPFFKQSNSISPFFKTPVGGHTSFFKSPAAVEDSLSKRRKSEDDLDMEASKDAKATISPGYAKRETVMTFPAFPAVAPVFSANIDRGSYKCGKCGEIKKGHKCVYDEPKETFTIGTQWEEGMHSRRGCRIVTASRKPYVAKASGHPPSTMSWNQTRQQTMATDLKLAANMKIGQHRAKKQQQPFVGALLASSQSTRVA